MHFPLNANVSPSHGFNRSMKMKAIFIIVFALLAASLGVEISWLHQRREGRAVAWANQRILQEIAAARVDMAERHWNKAVDRLERALDEAYASNRDALYPVMEEAKRGQAETLLQGAEIALAHQKEADAQKLLGDYLAHPQASHRERAEQLRDELKRALSDDEALRFLARLSDEALTVFVERGQLTQDDGLHTNAAHLLFSETLRKNTAKELQRRQAQREVARLTEERRAAERERRRDRLKQTSAFRSLSAFLARMEDQVRAQRLQMEQREQELSRLFEILEVRDTAEQQRFRADLLDGESPVAIREQVERRRGECKRAFHNAPESTPADRELFDLLVDETVDHFLKTSQASGGR
jgi:hypothetical protein